MPIAKLNRSRKRRLVLQRRSRANPVFVFLKFFFCSLDLSRHTPAFFLLALQRRHLPENILAFLCRAAEIFCAPVLETRLTNDVLEKMTSFRNHMRSRLNIIGLQMRLSKLFLLAALVFGLSNSNLMAQDSSAAELLKRKDSVREIIYAKGGKDRDGDGLSDKIEKEYGTNPKSPDSDKDGLVDSDELLTFHTNPLKADTDDDGLTDFEEVHKYRTFPNLPDSDQDGLSDGEEIHKHNTNPLKMDSDLDGLTDGEELSQYGTDPREADTDGDGVIDGIEVNSYVSNPLATDSDGDGVPDGEDKCPTEPATTSGYRAEYGCPDIRPQLWVEVDNVMVLTGVNFLAGQAEPTRESLAVLDKVFQTLSENPDVAFEIRGYADGAGDAQRNLLLSTRRAESVYSYLVTRGIAAERLLVVGYGEENPIASNDTPEGRAKNRRIELHRVR